jgi:hypothetical protein
MINRAVKTLAAAVLLACSDDDETGPSTDLSGTYTLQSFQQAENPALTPTSIPPATGTLVLTATTYNVAINIGGQPAVVDQGTYTTNGNQFSQSGTLGQATGTYTQNGNTFSTDLTASGIRIRSTWLKQ